MQPRVNVIVVSRDLWQMTRTMLEGLIFTADVPWFLHFYSNGSEDETEEEFNKLAPTWVWQNFCGYKATFRERPQSLAAAWNAALRYMPDKETPYTLFANNDIVFHKSGWMSQMVDRIDQGLGLVGIQEMTWYRFRFVEGSLFMVPTTVLNTLKRSKYQVFDTQFKLSCEDVDLSERFLRAGLDIGQVALQPEWLTHIGHQTINEVGRSGENVMAKMHASRRLLCKKYGYDAQIED